MKKSKKILAVLLALVMLLASVPVMTAMAAETKHEHVYSVKVVNEEKVVVKPTCETPGYTVYVCECGNEKTAYTEALGHNLIGSYTKTANSHSQYCDRCKSQVPADHNWEDVNVTKEPTCVEPGKKNIKCKDCKFEQKDVEIPAKGHTIKTVAAKDITDKKHTGVCTVCEMTVTDDHNWGEGVVTKAPKCNAVGELTYTCTVCKKIAKADTNKAEVISIVGEEQAKEDWKKINKTHTFGDWKSASENSHQKECACGERKTEVHKFIVVEGKKSLCDDSVSLTITCADCNYKLETKATQHEFKAVEKYDANNHKQVCKKCNINITAPHNWKDVRVTKAATCKEAGEKTVECMDCKETSTVAIPKLEEHKWDAGTVTTEATCGKAGVKTFKCSVCELTKTEEIAATGKHTYGEWKVLIPATPITEGTKICECTVCGDKKTESVKYEEPAKAKLGDVNGDGDVTAVDARLVLQSVAELRVLTATEKEAADMNADGNVTAVDARVILQVVAGLK